MTNVTFTVHGDNDGYISADTDAWIAERMTRDDALTASLGEWLRARDDDPAYDRHGCYMATNYSGQYYPHANHIAQWAWVTFRGAPEPGPWWCADMYPSAGNMATFNEGDQILSEEIGALWFPTDEGAVFVHQSEGAYGTYISPVVYRVTCAVECLTEYREARAECAGCETVFTATNGGTRLESWDGDAYARLTECARYDDETGTGFIACPYCSARGESAALTFDMPVW